MEISAITGSDFDGIQQPFMRRVMVNLINKPFVVEQLMLVPDGKNSRIKANSSEYACEKIQNIDL
jgi:hypothetical protein